MTHVLLLFQSLLSAFTRDEPYVSKFLCRFVPTSGEQAIWDSGSFPGELVNL